MMKQRTGFRFWSNPLQRDVTFVRTLGAVAW